MLKRESSEAEITTDREDGIVCLRVLFESDLWPVVRAAAGPA